MILNDPIHAVSYRKHGGKKRDMMVIKQTAAVWLQVPTTGKLDAKMGRRVDDGERSTVPRMDNSVTYVLL